MMTMKRKIKSRIYSFSATLCSVVMVLTIILSVLKMGEEAWGAEIQTEVTGHDIVERAIEYLGVPYHSYTDEEVNKYGVDQSKGFDCSNYVKTVCDSLGFRKDSSYTMPTGPWSWYTLQNFMYKNVNYNIEVVDINDKSSWQPGDIMIFGNSTRPWTHMAIYVGEYNNADSMIKSLGLTKEQAKYIVDYNTGCTSWRINCMGNPTMTDMGYPYCVRLDNGMDGKMGNGYVTKIIRLTAKSLKEPTYGNITFSKVGKNVEASIPNVQWRLYSLKELAEKALNERGTASDTVPYITSFTTDSDGYAEFEIDNGVYYAIEWKTKTGSSLSDTIYKVDITEDTKQLLTNDEWYISLKIKKVDSVDSAKLLNGAEFTLYEYNKTTESFVEAGKLKNTDLGIYEVGEYSLINNASGNKKQISDGKLYYTEYNLGQFKIVETKNPEGYSGDYTGYISISEDNNGTVIEKTVENTPSTGKIVINKYNALNTEMPVEGALINLYSDKACKNFIAQCVTDKNGIGRFYYQEGIQITEEIYKWSEEKEFIFKPGTYYVKEQDAPVGYFTNQNVFEVTVSYGESVVNILDNPKPGYVVLYKYDESKVTYDTNGNIVGGMFLKDAVYGIYTDKECRNLAKYVEYSEDLTKTIFTDKTAILTTKDDGSVSSGYLLPGTYYVKEISAPTGYLVNDTVYSVEVKGNAFTNVFALDKAKELALVIHKTDTITGANAQGNATFEGAQFALYAEENIYAKESGDLMFIANKQIALYKKADGTYTFKTDESQVTEKATTDSSGTVTITGLIPGKYYITERVAPNGYTLNDDLKIHIDLSDSTFTSYKSYMSNPSELAKVEVLEEKEDGNYHVYFNDDVLTGELIISKYDKATGEALNGAYFSLYSVRDILLSNGLEKLEIDENNEVKLDGIDLTDLEIGLGENIGYIGMTSDNGKLHIKDIPYGIYLVKEVKAPAGYKLAGAKIVVIGPEKDSNELANIKELGIYSVDVYNELMPQTLTINKYVADLGFEIHPTSPATFALKDANGNIISEKSCDSNGSIIFDNLYPGTYTLEETVVPEGYLKVFKDISVTINKTNNSYAVIDGEKVSLKYASDYNMLLDIPNAKNILTINKVDEKGNHLAGAELGLYIKESDGSLTEIAKWETDGSPKSFETIKDGIYVLKEIKAPSGYILAADIEFEIKGEPKVITMTDIPEGKPPVEEVEPEEVPTEPTPIPPEIEEDDFYYEPVQTGIENMKIEFLVIILSGAGLIISIALFIYNEKSIDEELPH